MHAAGADDEHAARSDTPSDNIDTGGDRAAGSVEIVDAPSGGSDGHKSESSDGMGADIGEEVENPGLDNFSDSDSDNQPGGAGAGAGAILPGYGGNGDDDGTGESDDDMDDLDDDEDIDDFDEDEAGWWGNGPLGMFAGGEDVWDDDEEEDMWLHDDEFLGDFDDDDFSDASTVEPDDEAEACDRAVEATLDRHLLHPPTPYALPSSSFHFQSADALAVASDPHCPGSTLVATMDTDGVLLFRMPSVGSMTQVGGPPQSMKFLGGVESPSQSAYSMEISPSGRYLLAGGEEGSLEMYLIDSRAPQRPPIPAEVTAPLGERQPFFYLPIIPRDTDWVTGSRPRRVAQEVHEMLTAPRNEQVPQHASPKNYPRTINDARFLNVLGFRDTAALTPENAEEVLPPEMPEGAEPTKRVPFGWVPRDLFYAAAVDEQVVGLEEQFIKFANMVGGPDKIDWQMEDEMGDAEMEGAIDTQGTEAVVQPAAPLPQRGALCLGGMLVLGYPDHDTAVQNTTNEDGMVNGVRFGVVAGKERVLAAEQSGKVYVFEVPSADTPIEEVASSMMCEGLGAPSSHWRMQPVVAFSAADNPFGAALTRRATVLSTATIGPFGVPLNMAAASPDGNWIAVVGDHKKVHLLDQKNGFADRELPFEPARFDYDFLDTDIEVGAQYCTWNSSSSLLAVTSDALHAVFVFSVPSGQLVMRVEGFIRSVLPVTFAPWSDNVLIFAEESKMLHVRVVDLDGGVVNYNAREGKRKKRKNHMEKHFIFIN